MYLLKEQGNEWKYALLGPLDLTLAKGILFRKIHIEKLAAYDWIGLLTSNSYDLHVSRVGNEHVCKTSGQQVSP